MPRTAHNSLVEIRCPCGQPFTTRAKTVTRSPCCHRSVRIPPRLRMLPGAQLVAAATGLVNDEPRTSKTRAPKKSAQVASTPVIAPVVADPVPALPEPDPDDDSDIRNQTYDAIKRVVVDKQPQQITAAPQVIYIIERTINEVLSDEPTLRYNTGLAADGMMTLRMWADSEELLMPKVAATVVPALESVARQIRSFRTEKVQRCDWPDCQARRYVDTPELYTVTSPAFSRPVNLCHRHMMMEVSIVGCNVKVAAA